MRTRDISDSTYFFVQGFDNAELQNIAVLYLMMMLLQHHHKECILLSSIEKGDSGVIEGISIPKCKQ